MPGIRGPADFSQEPPRHPCLRVNAKVPFNAEPPCSALISSYVTPVDLFYKRNHGPIPIVDDIERYCVSICGLLENPKQLYMNDIRLVFGGGYSLGGQLVATVCMFLAGKVEETPRPLKDVILVSYEIIHKKDPTAVQRIKQKEVYEQQKELILHGERVVLGTLAFDFNVHHPYKPLVEAIKKFKVAQNALAQVAWNFVNDGLRTSLCLQFKPHHIAADAIFLAAKFLKVKLPSDGERVWWQEFDVTPRQLEEVSNQMLELYEQNRLPPSQGSEIEGSTGIGASHRAPSKVPTASEEHGTSTATKPLSKPTSSRLVSDQPYSETHREV